jgi:ATPase subunit of ABC transporter with duplicated ATPase domains
VIRGERICLMGRNGAGKTTLLKSLLANYPGLADKDFTLDSGAVSWGHEAQIGYFPQDVGALIEHGLTVSEWLHRFNPAAHVEEIRGILGQMLFSGEEGDKQTKALSGGEQARLVFCKLILTKPNFLIFDEPTNHLDLEAINALNIALQRYEGTVLLVTGSSKKTASKTSKAPTPSGRASIINAQSCQARKAAGESGNTANIKVCCRLQHSLN